MPYAKRVGSRSTNLGCGRNDAAINPLNRNNQHFKLSKRANDSRG
jgi:hypothetical protein